MISFSTHLCLFGGSDSNESAYNAGDLGSIPGLLSDLVDCSPPGSSIHGIFQARVLEWGAIAFSVSAIYSVLIN